jgi:hypothetical protein
LISKATTDDEIEALAGHLCPDPMEDPDGPILSGFADECRVERAALRDPYGMGDPGACFSWRADAALGEVAVYPRDESELAAQVFDAAKKHLGINRESLKKARWDYAYRHLWTLKELLEELDRHGGHEAARRITADGIQAMMGPRQPYAGMVRYFVQIEWRLDL